ncbi:MAG: hypothetical protein ACREGB_00355 [Candidatus Saccharimonadales bacterium]
MRSIEETPTADYWQEVRELDDQIYQREKRLTPVIYPWTHAVDAWASDSLEYDTTGYRAEQGLSFRDNHRKHIALTLFTLMNVGREKQSLARLYELDLTPGREDLIVFPVYGRLTGFGIAGATRYERFVLGRQRTHAQSLGGKRADFTAANEADYELVREQLARGASGCYPRARKA